MPSLDFTCSVNEFFGRDECRDARRKLDEFTRLARRMDAMAMPRLVLTSRSDYQRLLYDQMEWRYETTAHSCPQPDDSSENETPQEPDRFRMLVAPGQELGEEKGDG